MRTPLQAVGVMPLLIVLFAIGACSGADSHDHGHSHDESVLQGPNGGRLIEKGAVSLELKIEEGSTPRFVAWAYRDGKLLPPERVRLSVTTERLGGAREAFAFAATQQRLEAIEGVAEPHSFVIAVDAAVDGEALAERYDSFEGRTTIPAAAAREAGVVTAKVAPGDIIESAIVNGLVTARAGGEASVTVRFPGVVRRIDVEIGDRVAKGQVLAAIESDASLAEYAVRAPITGVVVAREARLGEAAAGAPLFTVVDLDSLLVELRLFGVEATHIKPGARVRVSDSAPDRAVTSEIARISPAFEASSQSMLAQARLDNRERRWRPGMAVKGAIELRAAPAALRVPVGALQTFWDWDVVFIRVGDIYEARPVTLGRRGDEFVEVLAGLQAGDEIVVEQSYLIKADIEKSGAVHDH